MATNLEINADPGRTDASFVIEVRGLDVVIHKVGRDSLGNVAYYRPLVYGPEVTDAAMDLAQLLMGPFEEKQDAAVSSGGSQ